MFKPVKLSKYRILVLTQDLQNLLDELHESGITSISLIDKSDKNVSGILETCKQPETAKFSAYNLTRVKRLISFTSSFDEKKPLAESAKDWLFEEKIKTKEFPNNFKKLEKYTKEILEKLEPEVNNLESEIKEIDDTKHKLELEISALQLLKQLEIDLELLYGFRTINVNVGKIPVELEKGLNEEINQIQDAEILKSTGAKEKIIIVTNPIEKQDDVGRALRKSGFESIDVPQRQGNAKELINKLTKEIETLNKKKEKIIKQVKKLKKANIEELHFLQELLDIEKDKANAFSFIGQTEKTSLLEVWVKAKNKKKLVKLCEKATKERLYAEEIDFEEETAPVELRNPKYVRNYEYLTEMFGIPKYSKTDPTLFMSIFFPLYFGIALGDVGYGIMLLAMALFFRYTVGLKNENNKRLSNILIYGGITTTFFGFMFGSFFGDLLGESFKPILFNLFTQEGTMTLLSSVLVIGVVHVNLGILTGMMEKIREKTYNKMILQDIPWLTLQLGVLFLVLNMMLGFSEIFSYLGYALLLLTAVLLIKNEGPLGIMGFSSFGGNILSYARLLALGLATSAIALAINLLGTLMGAAIPVVGGLVTAIFLIVAHIANFLFNLLGSFIHSLRLHFVEFFGYFYEGGGQKFTPYIAKRKYSKIGGEK